MDVLRKTVLIGCLIYGLYGLVSLVELGSFIPPIPLKPFVFAVFLIVYVSVSRQDFSPLLRISLLVWMMSLIFVGQHFVETLFNSETVNFYLNNVEPFVLMGSISAFIAFTYKLVGELSYRSIKYYLPIIISASIIPLTILVKDQIIFDWGMITIAFLFFILERMEKREVTEEKYEKIFFVLYGVSIITTIELATYIFI